MPNFDISQENTEFGIRGQIRPAGIQKLQGHTFRRDDFWGPEIVPPERVALRVLKFPLYSGGTNYFPGGRFLDPGNRPVGTRGHADFKKNLRKKRKPARPHVSAGRFLGPRNRPAGTCGLAGFETLPIFRRDELFSGGTIFGPQ